jgi:hypothetical protein
VSIVIADARDLAYSVARRRVRAWMRQERPYAESKWPTDGEVDVLDGKTAMPWADWVVQYLGRATTLGLDTERGRVALAKAIMTATRVLEEAIVQHGPLPDGGTPS